MTTKCDSCGMVIADIVSINMILHLLLKFEARPTMASYIKSKNDLLLYVFSNESAYALEKQQAV